MRDIVFLSLENWDDIWRRNQFLCATLARRHPENRILFVGLPRDISNQIRRMKFSVIAQEAANNAYSPDGLPNVTIIHPYKFLPNTLKAGRLVNEWLYRASIRRAMRQLKIKNPLLWVNPHWANHCVGKLDESASIYDITDDWTTLTQSPRLTALVKAQDADLCKFANATIVCSPHLRTMKQSMAKSLHYVPNGVDSAHYARVLDAPASHSGIPALDQQSLTHPVFGYTGTIHPDRVDLSLLKDVAMRLSKATFLMVGPNFVPAEQMCELTSLPNIRFTGPVPYASIPEVMAHFDVCMTPHCVTPFTESLNPIKLWEYLAAGKPIVSTDVAGFRDYPEHVAIARSPAEFAQSLMNALEAIPARSDARRREAANHSWNSRVDLIEEIMTSLSHRELSSKTPPADQVRIEVARG